jgi:hypothetical protein
MSKLTLIQPPARYRGELFNRDLNAKLATAHAFGASFFPRLATMLRIIFARQQNPKCIVEHTPKPPKIARPAGIWRRHRKDTPRKPCRAEVEMILNSRDGRTYLRLDNGQIVRAQRGNDLIHAFPPGAPVTLRPEDQAQLPSQDLPRYEEVR